METNLKFGSVFVCFLLFGKFPAEVGALRHTRCKTSQDCQKPEDIQFCDEVFFACMKCDDYCNGSDETKRHCLNKCPGEILEYFSMSLRTKVKIYARILSTAEKRHWSQLVTMDLVFGSNVWEYWISLFTECPQYLDLNHSSIWVLILMPKKQQMIFRNKWITN